VACAWKFPDPVPSKTLTVSSTPSQPQYRDGHLRQSHPPQHLPGPDHGDHTIVCDFQSGGQRLLRLTGICVVVTCLYMVDLTLESSQVRNLWPDGKSQLVRIKGGCRVQTLKDY
jgi:hypothetical protein